MTRGRRAVGLIGGALVACTALVGCGKVARPPAGPSEAEALSAEAGARVGDGQWETAEQLLVRAIARGELLDDLVGQASAWSNIGVLLASRGDLEHAVRAHEVALERLGAARVESGDCYENVRLNLALALIGAGRADAASTYLEGPGGVAPPSELDRALRVAKRRHRQEQRWIRRDERATAFVGPRFVAWEQSLRRQTAQAAAQLAQGDAGGARRLAAAVVERADAEADTPGAPVANVLGGALAIQGAALHALGERAEATSSFERALAVDRRRGDPVAVQQHLGWLASLATGSDAARYAVRRARVARQLGQLDRARSDLVAAANGATPELGAVICDEQQLLELSAQHTRVGLPELLAVIDAPDDCAPLSSPATSPPSADPSQAPAAAEAASGEAEAMSGEAVSGEAVSGEAVPGIAAPGDHGR